MLGLCDQFLYAPETFNVGTRTELRVSGIGLGVGVKDLRGVVLDDRESLNAEA